MGSFCRSPDACEMLPPTSSAHHEHVRRAHYAAAVWNSSHQASQILPNIEEFGWQKDNETGAFIAKASSSPIAPKEILELVKCGCKGRCETDKCSCYRKRLSCTEMCHCTECENTDFSTEMQYQDDEEDETDD